MDNCHNNYPYIVCSRPGHACLATRTQETAVSVLVAECGLGTGPCAKMCSNITITEDTECGCGCDLDRYRHAH